VPRHLSVFFTVAAALAAGCVMHAPDASHPDIAGAAAPAAADTVELTGNFHIVWGDRPVYWLITTDGAWTELVIDRATELPPGGPTTLDRRRVRAIGILLPGDPASLRLSRITTIEERRP
jgi:hypothetical protein